MTNPRPKRRLLLIVLTAAMLLVLIAVVTLAVFFASVGARDMQSSELADGNDEEEHLTFSQHLTRLKVGFQFLWYDMKDAVSRKLAGESVEVPPPTVQVEEEPETNEPD